MIGDNCREGCYEKNHNSYSECLQGAGILMSASINSPLAALHDVTRKELTAYQNARSNGIQPEGTSMEKIRAAESASKNLGRAYNADVDPPARMITNKTVGSFVKTSAGV